MPNSECTDEMKQLLDEDPFQGMHIEDDKFLDKLEGRYPCPKCGKSRKYFCYTCYVPVSELEGKLPVVKLPLQIDIIKHKHEIDGKSTAAHAAVLASHDIRVFTYPNIPNYKNCNVVLIFPSYDALNVNSLFKDDNRNSEASKIVYEELPKGFNRTTLLTKRILDSNIEFQKSNLQGLPIDRAVFIDSTWNQSKGIFKDCRLNTLPCIVLQNRISQFWRHQRGSPRWYLSTVEAIHQFLVEIHLNMWGLNESYKGLNKCFTNDTLQQMKSSFAEKSANSYCGQYDNLLFFFKHMYYLIHAHYDHEMLYAYKRRLL